MEKKPSLMLGNKPFRPHPAGTTQAAQRRAAVPGEDNLLLRWERRYPSQPPSAGGPRRHGPGSRAARQPTRQAASQAASRHQPAADTRRHQPAPPRRHQAAPSGQRRAAGGSARPMPHSSRAKTVANQWQISGKSVANQWQISGKLAIIVFPRIRRIRNPIGSLGYYSPCHALCAETQ